MEDQGFTPASNEVKQHHEKIVAEALKKGSYGMKLVGRAAQSASAFAETDGLHPAIDEYGDYRYKVQQGLRAACVGREDAAATLILMQTVLDNQRTIKRLIWIGLAVLAYIAIKM